MMRDADSAKEQVLQALPGDLRGAKDRDVADVFEEQSLIDAVAAADHQGLAPLAQHCAGRRDVHKSPVITAGHDPA